MRRKGLEAITHALKQFKPFYTEKLLRRKINILRTNFNKEFKKREQMRLNRHDYEEHAALWYYDSLLFLKDESYAKTAIEATRESGLYMVSFFYPAR